VIVPPNHDVMRIKLLLHDHDLIGRGAMVFSTRICSYRIERFFLCIHVVK